MQGRTGVEHASHGVKAVHTGATTGDAAIAFMDHFEAHPALWIGFAVVLIVATFAVARLATYILPKDLAKMVEQFYKGQTEGKPPLLDLMKRGDGDE